MDPSMEQAAPEAAPEAAPQEGGDIGKLIQGVGMGLQKLAETLPPELADQMNALVSEFQNILSGQPEESSEEQAGAMPMGAGGKVSQMGGANGKPMM